MLRIFVGRGPFRRLNHAEQRDYGGEADLTVSFV